MKLELSDADKRLLEKKVHSMFSKSQRYDAKIRQKMSNHFGSCLALERWAQAVTDKTADVGYWGRVNVVYGSPMKLRAKLNSMTGRPATNYVWVATRVVDCYEVLGWVGGESLSNKDIELVEGVQYYSVPTKELSKDFEKLAVILAAGPISRA